MIRLAKRESTDKEKIDIKNLAKLLYVTLMNISVIENNVVVDPIFTGCLLMLETLDEVFKSHIEESISEIYSNDFLVFLLSKGLFSREKIDMDNSDITYPLCKHDKTRRYAFQLVPQLFGNEGMKTVSNFFSPIIKNGSWRTNKREKWFIASSKLLKRTTHIGLVNLGCTWYMNSLIQQLFMSPYFRSFVFSAIDQKKHELLIEDNVLYQSKYLFTNLMNSKMPTYNPVVFFNSTKDFNGEPMSTNEQEMLTSSWIFIWTR